MPFLGLADGMQCKAIQAVWRATPVRCDAAVGPAGTRNRGHVSWAAASDHRPQLTRRLAVFDGSAAHVFSSNVYDKQSKEQSQEPTTSCPQLSGKMLDVNASLFLTGLLEKILARTLVSVGIMLATAALTVLAVRPADAWLYVGIGLTSAGTGLVLPVIAYIAAGALQHTPGATMGGLAAGAGLGQMLETLCAVAHRRRIQTGAVCALPVRAIERADVSHIYPLTTERNSSCIRKT